MKTIQCEVEIDCINIKLNTVGKSSEIDDVRVNDPNWERIRDKDNKTSKMNSANVGQL